jgi:ABC-2 type transport system ATP-binding protein
MSAVVEVSHLTRRFGDTTAVDDVSFSVQKNTIHGLLGRNGAGKTTLMQLLTGQVFATEGTMEVLGAHPVENAEVLSQTCFIQESQKYPDTFRAIDVLRIAAGAYPHWDHAFADQLVGEFKLPVKRMIKKLSRGQLSAIGIVVGLASRAPVTFFDEPYLGLDAVARQLFYDRLLSDYAEHPRTVVLSTHLIDEVSDLLEHVIVIDDGRIIIDSDADSLRGSVTAVAGTASAVDAFSKGREVLHREQLGGLASATLSGLDAAGRRAAAEAGLELAPVSLQQLIVRSTTTTTGGDLR